MILHGYSYSEETAKILIFPEVPGIPRIFGEIFSKKYELPGDL
jgi:hypothetical protein